MVSTLFFVVLLNGFANLVLADTHLVIYHSPYDPSPKRYYISSHNDTATFLNAVEQCLKRHMVPLSSSGINVRLQLELQSHGHQYAFEDFWSAGTNLNSTDGKYIWLYPLASFEFHSKHGVIKDRCLKFRINHVYKPQWYDESCSKKLRYICTTIAEDVQLRSLSGVLGSVGTTVKQLARRMLHLTGRAALLVRNTFISLGTYTADQIAKFDDAFTKVVRETGRTIGISAKEATIWMKGNAGLLIERISEALKWSKEKVKQALDNTITAIQHTEESP